MSFRAALPSAGQNQMRQCFNIWLLLFCLCKTRAAAHLQHSSPSRPTGRSHTIKPALGEMDNLVQSYNQMHKCSTEMGKWPPQHTLRGTDTSVIKDITDLKV